MSDDNIVKFKSIKGGGSDDGTSPYELEAIEVVFTDNSKQVVPYPVMVSYDAMGHLYVMEDDGSQHIFMLPALRNYTLLGKFVEEQGEVH